MIDLAIGPGHALVPSALLSSRSPMGPQQSRTKEEQNLHRNAHLGMVRHMQRLYTAKTETVSRALELTVSQGLAAPGASQSEKLARLIEFAESRLAEEQNRAERAEAYEAIAGDAERAQAIRASVLDGASHGLI